MAKDLFSTHAADYAKFRPTYPVELIKYIASLAERRDVALDCATGNGQAAILLANYFNKVLATDLSVQQISEAETHPLVQYSVSSAESNLLKTILLMPSPLPRLITGSIIRNLQKRPPVSGKIVPLLR